MSKIFKFKNIIKPALLNFWFNSSIPEFLFDEFIKYEQYILEKTNRSKEDFEHYLNILREEIEIIPENIITPFLED
jgi:hypothetical protein